MRWAKRVLVRSVVAVLVLGVAAFAQPLGCTSIVPPNVCTTLPIVRINANGQYIDPDYPNPKLVVDLEIVDSGTGLNWFNGTANVYSGQARFKVRGQTSRANAKKSYTIETWSGFVANVSDGDKNKVSLFGMPSDSQWAAYAPWGDKPMVRNQVVLNMTRQTGAWAPHGVYVEMFLHAANTYNVWQYIGVYVLMEKVTRGKDRVDIKKLSASDNSPPAVTGGYLLKIDKIHPGEVAFNITLPSGTVLYGVDPDIDSITAAQAEYITGFMTAFETALNATDLYTAVSEYANLTSFVDYFLIQEAVWNQDGFKASTYFAKDRGGLLTAGPVWDMDVSFANMYAPTPQGWQFQAWGSLVPYWWGRLLEAPEYQAAVVARWKELRGWLYTNETLAGLVADAVDSLYFADDVPSSPEARNYARYLYTLNTWQWPGLKGSKYIHTTYPPYVVDGFSTWWPQRLLWIDENLPLLMADATSARRRRGARVL